MTLVVAKMHDDEVSIVADTKITDELGDESWNRQVYRHACPKIRILRDDLAVGVAGRNPHHVLERLNELRSRPVDEVLKSLATHEHASFVVASLSPSCQLWKVKGRQVERRTSIGRCWVGDPAANEIFTEQYHNSKKSMPDADTSLLLNVSMQWLLSFNLVDTVGGYLTRLRTTRKGFRFAHDYTDVGPDLVDGEVRKIPDGISLRLRTPTGVASRGYRVRLAVGQVPTIGALACLIPEARTAWLFCDERPWLAQLVQAESMEELIRMAASGYGQTLAAPPS